MKVVRNAEDFAATQNVSRETISRLQAYEALLRRWNVKINLVAKSTLDDIWQRHFADSAQLFQLARQKSGLWVDLGSGAGFPGMVLAIMARELAPDLRIALIESDQRKCAFLQTVATAVAVDAKIISQRAELVEPQNANLVVARALAALTELIPLAQRHLANDGECLFLKGVTAESELTAVGRIWDSSVETIPSVTDPNGVVLRIGDIHRV
jgi:16S rRNA (guanine527-N7)-methyltransferase